MQQQYTTACNSPSADSITSWTRNFRNLPTKCNFLIQPKTEPVQAHCYYSLMQHWKINQPHGLQLKRIYHRQQTTTSVTFHFISKSTSVLSTTLNFSSACLHKSPTWKNSSMSFHLAPIQVNRYTFIHPSNWLIIVAEQHVPTCGIQPPFALVHYVAWQNHLPFPTLCFQATTCRHAYVWSDTSACINFDICPVRMYYTDSPGVFL